MVSTYVKLFGSSSEDWPGLPESQRQILLLVYRLCAPVHVEGTAPDKIDESFLGLIEFDEMTQIIVPNLFDPIQWQDQQLPKNVVWAACHILSTYGKIKGFANTTAEGYVKKYGADPMAKICAVMIESSPAWVNMLVHVSSLVQYLLFAPAIHRSIIHTWRLQLRLMKKWWEAERAASERPVDVGFGHNFFFGDLGALLLALSTRMLQKDTISDLVQQQDLILLLGFGPIRRTDLVGPPYLSGQWLEPFHKFAVAFCRDDVRLMTEHIKPMWLHVMDCLRPIKRCADPLWEKIKNKEPSEVDLWQAFGAELGLSEGSLRRERAQARREESEGLVGCFFLKCPLYGEDINDRPNSPLCCVECKSAQYCSTSCQKLDWRNRHKRLCRPDSPILPSGVAEPQRS